VSLVENERTKLLAGALDRVSTTCVTVGVAGLAAGVFYGLSGIGIWYLVAACYVWISVAISLHLFAPLILGKLQE
jgi:hypothetical protein